MLSDEERRAIETEMSRYEHKRAASVDALKIIQRHRGWVDDAALRDAAELLGGSPAELDGVATFYNLIFRHPVGRHVILLCDSISCWICGYEPVHRELRERLGIAMGQTTPDGRFTLLPTACLGACDGAPVLLIDDDLHRNLTPGCLDTILANYD
ncbi:MAG: NADH-quinone oxidoreductase subunit NuoE [Nitrococcus mobilis]|nr:NADH-quinone oxidoreductase subunit NuoE [Nitrococcus mobilis]